MLAVIAAPMIVSMVLALTATRLGRWLPPATAVRLLSTTGLVTALSAGFVLCMTAGVGLAQIPPVAALGRWSARALAASEPVPLLLGATCGGAAMVFIGAAAWRLIVTARDLAAAVAACRRLGAGVAGLIVVEDEAPDAYALPGLSGRVIVSTAMLRELPAPERRALLAHEASHLRHHHHLYVQVAELSAAANPLLRPIASAVRAGVERWADEDAAVATGDRSVTARAVARASLAQRRPAPDRRSLNLALGVGDSLAVARTMALMAPAPTPRRSLSAGVALVATAAAVGAITAGHQTEHVFEIAKWTFAHQR